MPNVLQDETMIVLLKPHIDPEDREAFCRELERIYLRYGPKPSPHLVKERDTALKNAASTLGRCVQWRKFDLSGKPIE
jgi:hypothetical protein